MGDDHDDGAPSQNIRVAVRCRPMNQRELSRGAATAIEVGSSGVVLVAPKPDEAATSQPKQFTYDFAYGTDTQQKDVYTDVGAVVAARALQGYNGTVFAYGQTGSGKTWTMMGGDSVDTRGVIPRLVDDVFGKLDALRASPGDDDDGDDGDGDAKQTAYMVTVSYLEIYNEVLRDLLNPRAGGHLDIREHPEHGIYVKGLAEMVVATGADVLRMLAQGSAVRRVAATNMNDTSSRSHSVFTMKVDQKTTETVDDGDGDKKRETTVTAKVNLVDLAGSERQARTGATGDRLSEGAAINKSLMMLGRVIKMLADSKSKHIPYRDSKLTLLLRESLGGNASTLMMAAVSPADDSRDETMSTLRYASSAKQITNKVVKNEGVQEKMIRELKAELEALRAQVASGGGGGGGESGGGSGGLSKEQAEQLRHLEELETAQRQDWEEKKRLTAALEEERAANMNTTLAGVMDAAKTSKLEVLQRIKDLQGQKAGQAKLDKVARAQYKKRKATLEEAMHRYEGLQAEYDEADAAGDQLTRHAVEPQLLALMGVIQTQRDEMIKQRAALSSTKTALHELDEALAAARAELVTSTHMLAEHDALRHAIADEERAKFEAAREALLEKELAAERQRLKEKETDLKRSLESELQDSVSAIESERDALRARVAAVAKEHTWMTHKIEVLEAEKHTLADEVAHELRDKHTLEEEVVALEARVTESEFAAETEQEKSEALQEEVWRLEQVAHDHHHAQPAAVAAVTTPVIDLDVSTPSAAAKGGGGGGGAGGGDASEQEYATFKAMMGLVEAERSEWEKKNAKLQALLGSAVQDVMRLATENEALRKRAAFS